MEREMTLSPNGFQIVAAATRQLATRTISYLSSNFIGAQCLQPLTRYYTKMLDRELNSRQTLHLVHAQLAFFFAAFPAEASLPVRAMALCWFWWAVRLCKGALQES